MDFETIFASPERYLVPELSTVLVNFPQDLKDWELFRLKGIIEEFNGPIFQRPSEAVESRNHPSAGIVFPSPTILTAFDPRNPSVLSPTPPIPPAPKPIPFEIPAPSREGHSTGRTHMPPTDGADAWDTGEEDFMHYVEDSPGK